MKWVCELVKTYIDKKILCGTRGMLGIGSSIGGTHATKETCKWNLA
jgi:hypothetical protein